MDELQAILNGGSISSDKVVLDSVVKEERYRDSFVPRLRQTVTYIVCSVLVNDRNEVLMVQEAKQSCRGKWYLPAGRMERNETIEMAARREVLEESGLTYNPTTLIFVEALSYHWLRFTLTGNVTGGTLKALTLTDKESLQAKWFDLTTIKSTLELRATDIFPLIDETLRRQSASTPVYRSILPTNCAHVKMLLRLVVLRTASKKHERQVLVGLKGHSHLPTAVFRDVYNTTRHFLQTVFKSLVEPRILGVVSLEHDGRPADKHDGMCLTLIMTVDGNAAEAVQIADDKRYQWLTVTDPDVITHLDCLSVGPVALCG